ncbi:MAG: UbiA prenyltransferase family protein [Nitrososphaeria archaeon]
MKDLFYLVKARVSVLAYVAAFDVTLLLATDFKLGFTLLLLSTVSVYLISLANYTLSDLMDIEEDMINKPGTPLASGMTSKRKASYFIAFMAITALFLGSFVNLEYEAFLALSFGLAVIYSGHSIRAKSRWWSKMFVAGLGAFMAPFTVTSVAGPSVTIFLMSMIFALWGIFSLNMGDVMDFEGDKRVGVISFAVMFGKKRAIKLLEVLLLAQLLAEICLTLSLNPHNILYVGVSVSMFLYFLNGIRKLDGVLAKKLKRSIRVLLILLQFAALTFAFQGLF